MKGKMEPMQQEKVDAYLAARTHLFTVCAGYLTTLKEKLSSAGAVESIVEKHLQLGYTEFDIQEERDEYTQELKVTLMQMAEHLQSGFTSGINDKIIPLTEDALWNEGQYRLHALDNELQSFVLRVVLEENLPMDVILACSDYQLARQEYANFFKQVKDEDSDLLAIPDIPPQGLATDGVAYPKEKFVEYKQAIIDTKESGVIKDDPEDGLKPAGVQVKNG
jgi:hypothetical protein